MGSNESFDSDQQREIALLDQQWNDLVNEYIGDPDIMNYPPNEDSRFIIAGQSAKQFETESKNRYIASEENLASPNERKHRTSVKTLGSSGNLRPVDGIFPRERRTEESEINRSRSHRNELSMASNIIGGSRHTNKKRQRKDASDEDSNDRQNTNRGGHEIESLRYKPIVTKESGIESSNQEEAYYVRRGRKKNNATKS